MIDNFKEFNESVSNTKNEIDARKDIATRTDLTVSTEIDPGHEIHPTISVYFPNLFMYIDLDKIDTKNYDNIPSPVGEKIGEIIQKLDRSLDEELETCLKNMQEKLKKAADEIHQLPNIKGLKYGL